MKPKVMIFPLAAFIVALCLLAFQSRAISLVREQEALLLKQIAGARGGSFSAPVTDATGSRGRATSKGSVNWLRLAKLTGEYNPGGIFAAQERKRAEKRIQAMSPAELLAALEQVKLLGLDTRSHGEIVGMLLAELGKKDPEAAANHLIVPANDHIGLSGGVMSSILANWSKNDFTGALTWFDQKIADGSFTSKSADGTNYRRLRLEGAFLSRLSLSDPEAAARRLTAYTPEERSGIFVEISQFDRLNSVTTDISAMAARVALARTSLSENSQAHLIAFSIGSFAQAGDYDKIDTFLGRVDATPAERVNSVLSASAERFRKLSSEGNLTVVEVDRFREWAAAQAPEQLDDYTGRALATVIANSRSGADSTAKIHELLSHYQDSSGSDEVLLGFLSSWPVLGDESKARSLAEKIRDPEKRARFLDSMKSNPFAP